jgi:hypothetical protein
LSPTSNSIPLDLSLIPGLTQSFSAFRAYKERVPIILRVPSASTGIFFASYTRKFTSRAHPDAYTRPHRTDPGVLPSRSVSIMEFKFCRDDATQESYFVIVSALFDCFNTENLRVAQPLININSLPMGVTSMNYIYWTIFSCFLYYSWKLRFHQVRDQRSRWEYPPRL